MTIPVPIEVRGEREARDRLQRINDQLDKLTGGTQSLARELRSTGPKTAIATVGLQALRDVAGSAYRVLGTLARTAQSAARQLVNLGMRGGDVSALAAAFERVGDPDLLSRLNSVTASLVRDTELMAASTRALRTGIVERDELVGWIEAVTRAAQDMGRNVSQSIQAVTTTLSGGGMESLNQLGVNVLSVREQVRLMGETMETDRGRVIALRLAMGQLGEDLGQIDNSAGNLNDAWTQLSNTFANYVDRVAQGFAENQQLLDFFADLRQTIEQSLPPVDEMADTLTAFFVSAVSAAQDLAQALVLAVEGVSRIGAMAARVADMAPWLFSPTAVGIEGFSDAMGEGADQAVGSFDRIGDAAQNLRGHLDGTQASVDRLRATSGQLARGESLELQSSFGQLYDELARAGGAVADVAGEVINLRSPTHTLVAELNSLSDANRGVSASASQTADELRAEATALRELSRAVREGQDWVSTAAAGGTGGNFRGHGAPESPATRGGGGGRSQAEQEQRQLEEQIRAETQKFNAYEQAALEAHNREEERRNELMREQIDLLRTERQVRTEAMQAENQQSIANMQAEIEQARQLTDVLDQAAEMEKAAAEQAAQKTAKTVGEITSISSSAASLMQSIGSIITANEKDIEKRKKKEGAFVIAYSSVMAAVELAQSIASFASQDYAAGAAHLAAMAAFIAAAAQAGSQLGGGAAAPTAGSYTPAEPDNASREQDRDPRVNITNYSLGRVHAELGQQLDRAHWERNRSGLAEPGVRGVNYR